MGIVLFGRNNRTHVLFVWFIVMSFVRTEIGSVGSDEGEVYGSSSKRVIVLFGFLMR